MQRQFLYAKREIFIDVVFKGKLRARFFFFYYWTKACLLCLCYGLTEDKSDIFIGSVSEQLHFSQT